MGIPGPTSILTGTLLRLMALIFNTNKSMNRYLKTDFGWLNFAVGIRTEDGSVSRAIRFHDGKVRVERYVKGKPDVTLIFSTQSVLREMLRVTPNEVLIMLMKNKLRIEGNLAYLQLFNFYISLLMGKKHQKMLDKIKRTDARERKIPVSLESTKKREDMLKRQRVRMKAEKVDPGVVYLEDPYLSEYVIDDFPRLKEFLDIHFTVTPEICHERPLLMTEWCIENGFETDSDGASWDPVLRQGYMLKYLMENRRPVIRTHDLLAGTTTAREIGVVLYPDSSGTMIWGELLSAEGRILNPYRVTGDTVDILHNRVFPYWIHRNFREWVREKYHNPLCQQLDERFAVYFLWKTVALSHTIPDFPKLLARGTSGIMADIDHELSSDEKLTQEKMNTLKAMKLTLEGLTAYAKNLSRKAALESERESDPQRNSELRDIADICGRVPEHPARTLHEAVQATWLAWVALHMENTNAGLSLGRLDQWLQPYFESDIKKLKTAEEREEYIRHAIELVGCFYMRCTDHLPLVPDIGNYLFGGSSSDQAITLGGVKPDGSDGVCDMTYIFLKVTELLGIRDPNVNARYDPQVNTDTYLKRLCEVNLITTATPSMHNDTAVKASLADFHYPEYDLRDWAATGCVEPTLSGKHLGHTNCMMMNMVAALEMALNNGTHPLMRFDRGPKTGSTGDGDFKTFEDFYTAFTEQFRFLIDQSVEYNNLLGEAHAVLRPTPLLSSLIEGTIQKGKDVTAGGALYNSSGAACIGLADVTDSLMAIKTLVFDRKQFSFPGLKEAVDADFRGHETIHAMITSKVPFFGSGNDEARDMAERVTRFARDTYWEHLNYRGGHYTAGFWSMSNHVAFGTLSGALPSGRRAGKAFTPGLTPEPGASKNLLDNIRDVASLEPSYMNNNIAFNVKVVPAPGDSHEHVVKNMYSYVKTYFDLGGMQMQMNVVTSDILRDAMAHPELYRNLLVRISGYNAYFVTLNRDMQVELIERAEYGI